MRLFVVAILALAFALATPQVQAQSYTCSTLGLEGMGIANCFGSDGSSFTCTALGLGGGISTGSCTQNSSGYSSTSQSNPGGLAYYQPCWQLLSVYGPNGTLARAGQRPVNIPGCSTPTAVPAAASGDPLTPDIRGVGRGGSYCFPC
jgi:hypothetical protein